MREEETKLAGKTKKKPPVLSTEDQEIKQLKDRRKDWKKKENRSERKKVEYTHLNKTEKEAQTKITKETYISFWNYTSKW